MNITFNNKDNRILFYIISYLIMLIFDVVCKTNTAINIIFVFILLELTAYHK